MLLSVIFPTEPFNALCAAQSGPDPAKHHGGAEARSGLFHRAAGKEVLVVDLANPSDVAKIAEPFFLQFNAVCRFKIVMSPEDLKKSGLDALGKKWG
jgi:hypothetical protein